MKKALLTTLVLGSLLGGCAMPPTHQDTARLPVVTFGDTVPKQKDYILHFPAGKAIPTDIVIGGNLFKQTGKDTVTVSLEQDIYAYGDWVSFDQKHWENSRDVLQLKVDIKVPGYKYPKPGHVRISLDKKNEH